MVDSDHASEAEERHLFHSGHLNACSPVFPKDVSPMKRKCVENSTVYHKEVSTHSPCLSPCPLSYLPEEIVRPGALKSRAQIAEEVSEMRDKPPKRCKQTKRERRFCHHQFCSPSLWVEHYLQGRSSCERRGCDHRELLRHFL